MCYQKKKYSKEKNNLPLFSEIMVGITTKIKDIENKAFKKCIMSEIAVFSSLFFLLILYSK